MFLFSENTCFFVSYSELSLWLDKPERLYFLHVQKQERVLCSEFRFSLARSYTELMHSKSIFWLCSTNLYAMLQNIRALNSIYHTIQVHVRVHTIKCIFKIQLLNKAIITGKLNSVLTLNLQKVWTAGAGVRSLLDMLIPSAFKRRVWS